MKMYQVVIIKNFLDLFDPLMSDSSIYIHKNPQLFAISDGLLRCYPELMMKRLIECAQQPGEQVRRCMED